MSRLLDRILRAPLLASRMGPVEGLPVIDASSVADLYAESPTMGVEEASWPNAAPPFPACWFEFGAPREVVLGPGKTQAWGPPWPRAWGFRVQVLEETDLDRMPPSRRLQEARDEVRWVYHAALWAEHGAGEITQESGRTYVVDAMGAIIDSHLALSHEVVTAFYQQSPAIASWMRDHETGEPLTALEAGRRYQAFEAGEPVGHLLRLPPARHLDDALPQRAAAGARPRPQGGQEGRPEARPAPGHLQHHRRRPDAPGATRGGRHGAARLGSSPAHLPRPLPDLLRGPAVVRAAWPARDVLDAAARARRPGRRRRGGQLQDSREAAGVGGVTQTVHIAPPALALSPWLPS